MTDAANIQIYKKHQDLEICIRLVTVLNKGHIDAGCYVQEVPAPRPGGPQCAGNGGRRRQGGGLRAGQGPPGKNIESLSV